MYLPNRLELLFLTVFALPKACCTCKLHAECGISRERTRGVSKRRTVKGRELSRDFGKGREGGEGWRTSRIGLDSTIICSISLCLLVREARYWIMSLVASVFPVYHVRME